MGNYYLIMDIGGTKTTGALFTTAGIIVEDYIYVVKSHTFDGEEAVYQNTKKVLDHIIDKFDLNMTDVLGIGVGCPGPLDTKTGIILHAPLMGWKDFPLVKRLERDFRVPVALDNDGNLGALAEQRCGVAKGIDNVLYMTVSTGCGGGIIVNGSIYHGHNDGAGEVGHMSIDPEGLLCPCGNKGCFEMYASGTAMNRRLRKDMEDGIRSMVFEMAQYNPDYLDGKILTDAAMADDPYALEFYKKEGYYLGVGISNIFNLLDPDVLVIGGGVSKAREFYHKDMMKVIRKRCIQPVLEKSVRYSVMNDQVVLYGAYYLIREHTVKNQTDKRRGELLWH